MMTYMGKYGWIETERSLSDQDALEKLTSLVHSGVKSIELPYPMFRELLEYVSTADGVEVSGSSVSVSGRRIVIGDVILSPETQQAASESE